MIDIFDYNKYLVTSSDLNLMRRNPNNLKAIQTYLNKVKEAEKYILFKRRMILIEAATELYESCKSSNNSSQV